MDRAICWLAGLLELLLDNGLTNHTVYYSMYVCARKSQRQVSTLAKTLSSLRNGLAAGC